VDSCFTRLRLVVKDSSLVDEATLKNDTGAMGIFKDGETVQVVYGLGINKVRGAVDAYLGNE
jgi:PTS system maltose and glucose-specific IIC component